MSDHPYTCVGCSLAFSTTEAQRLHYTSDLHRYNAKRRVAGLPAVTAEVYNAKIVQKKEQADEKRDRQFCSDCRKSFSSENAYSDHLHSKKHKEAQVKAIAQSFAPLPPSNSDPVKADGAPDTQVESDDVSAISEVFKDKSAVAPRIVELECLFCTRQLKSWQGKIGHMQRSHGFFIPDREYLTDEQGLISHLAELIAVWNICIVCNLGFGSHDEDESIPPERKARLARVGLDAVRKHMCSKNHCKILWDTEEERLELSDYYDFSATWQHDGASSSSTNENEDWEDMDVDSEEADIIVDETQATLPTTEVPHFGDTPFELVLPSGRRIGHRALRTFYKQNLQPAFDRQDETEQRRLGFLNDAAQQPSGSSESRALVVPQRNGQMLLARNPGEAKRATQQDVKEIRYRQEFQTKIGLVGNNQKHFRDFLLQ